jgi:hypothetical protein
MEAKAALEEAHREMDRLRRDYQVGGLRRDYQVGGLRRSKTSSFITPSTYVFLPASPAACVSLPPAGMIHHPPRAAWRCV